MLQLVASIGSFLPGLFGKEISFKAAKIIGFIILGVVLIAALILGKVAYDASVVNRYKTEQRADQAEGQLRAEHKADAVMANKAAQYDQMQAQLGEAGNTAATKDPAGAAKAVGPVTQSYYDTLRKEKK